MVPAGTVSRVSARPGVGSGVCRRVGTGSFSAAAAGVCSSAGEGEASASGSDMERDFGSACPPLSREIQNPSSAARASAPAPARIFFTKDFFYKGFLYKEFFL